MASLTVGCASEKTTNQKTMESIVFFLPMTAVIYQALEAKDVPANSRGLQLLVGTNGRRSNLNTGAHHCYTRAAEPGITDCRKETTAILGE
jgi:hypothetical protein